MKRFSLANLVVLALIGVVLWLGPKRIERGSATWSSNSATPVAGTPAPVRLIASPTPAHEPWDLAMTQPIGGKFFFGYPEQSSYPSECPPTCQITTTTGSVVIRAEEDEHHIFDGWSADCDARELEYSYCEVKPGVNRTVAGSFRATEMKQLTLSRPVAGYIEGQSYLRSDDPRGITCGVLSDVLLPQYRCDAKFPVGETATLEAIPDRDLGLARNLSYTWGGDCTGQGRVCTLVMNSDKIASVTFDFSAMKKVTMMAPENGFILYPFSRKRIVNYACWTDEERCQGVGNPGTKFTLHAEPDEGYMFGKWGGDCAGQGNPCELTLDTDKKVSAIFEQWYLFPTLLFR
jgi:hypothetical protein